VDAERNLAGAAVDQRLLEMLRAAGVGGHDGDVGGVAVAQDLDLGIPQRDRRAQGAIELPALGGDEGGVGAMS
jgi:hypothetical protein